MGGWLAGWLTRTGDVASCLLSISVSEGTIRQLDPDFDIINAALPYLFRYAGMEIFSKATSIVAGGGS